jgi:uncharacterized protein
MPTPSPCISVCQMDESTGWCRGCYRTIDEIIRWSQAGEGEKQAIWQALPARYVKQPFAEAQLNGALMRALSQEAE